MSVIIDVTIDTSQAQQQLAALQQQMAQQLAQSSQAAAQAAAAQAAAAAAAAAAAGNQASQGIAQLVLNETVDKFGDLKDIFEKTGVALFGLSEETVEAGVRIGDLAEKGAALGAAFGPIGAAVGLVAGGALGALVEKLTANKEEAEAAAAAAEAYAQKLERLKIAATITATQEELNKSIAEGTEILKTQSESLAFWNLAQETAALRVSQVNEKIAAYQTELDALNATTEDGTLINNTYEDSQRRQGLQFAINLTSASELAQAQVELTVATEGLTTAQEANLDVSRNLAQAQALIAMDSFEAAAGIDQQLDLILKGSKLASVSTAELEAQQEKLKQTINARRNSVESLALTNIELAASTDELSDATEAQAENEAESTKQKQLAVSELSKLAEITAELKNRRNELATATKTSTIQTTEDTKQIAENALVIEATNPIYKELVDLEREHYNIMLRKAKVERGDILDLGYLEDPIDTAKQAAKEAEAAGKDLMTMLEEDGRSVSERVQDRIDALREAKKQAAKDLQQQLTKEALADLAKAQQEVAKANVEAYKEILQPYTQFIGTVFTDFTNGMLAGQSATEAFAEATRKAIASALGSLAKELGVKSLANLAEGFAALSNPFTAAAAPGFFKASALYAAAAAAAGLGSSVLSTAGANSGASGLGAAGGGAAGTAAAGNTSTSLGRAAQETGTPAPIVIDLRGAMFPTTDLTAAQSFGEAVARSLAAASAGNQPMARRMFGSRGFVV